MSTRHEVWVLGATGRTGRTIAAELAGADVSTVLVGRDSTRLEEAAAAAGHDARTVVAGSLDAMTREIAQQRPAVVVNTIGPFTSTAVPIARACLPGSHYVDLANDVFAFTTLLGLHEQAVAAGRTLVTGAGFGVLATESVVVRLCAGRPAAERVRVDAVPSVAMNEGVLGEALAATIIDGLPHGGRRYRDGRLVRSRVGADQAQIVLPDGSRVTTASLPSGELIAAQRASGAATVIAASSEIPTGTAIHILLPLAQALLSLPWARSLARRRLAAIHLATRARPRQHSWGHAVVHWGDGTRREGWMRTGEGTEFTATVAALVAIALADGRAKPGAYTPAAALGPDIATAAGAEFTMA